ncbi:molybdotransferase-like divisome protein Glp [Phaeacidiphilus oryzae]|uniref:molybdotransferase-like divisome protein Glp n=1 Tax=Phaeacidiphilus oryzae TaxID=348818 RepID=UPI00055AC52F|nr:gephyrin-like molybdotransferase Glp [Phaeacidiphilus oryzae]
MQENPGAGSGDRLWTVDEHLADILRGVAPLPPIDLPLLDAQGLLLTEEVVAGTDLPPFDNSSMDGYAVRVADLAGATAEYPSVLTVVGEIAAGAGELPRVGPGECARIMTGAPMPPGAEAVVPVEWTDGGTGSDTPVDRMTPAASRARAGSDAAAGASADAAAGAPAEVKVFRPAARPGGFVRRRGGDVASGTVVLKPGVRLGPAQIGLAASVGRDRLRVRPRPRVVVLSTGSELVAPGTPVGPGQITDSNSFALTAAAREAGAEAYRVGGVPDDAGALREVLADQLGRADVVVTSGGVSVGAYDVVKEALSGGGEVAFRKLRMQPGKPQAFGLLDGRVPFFGLPGNPVSAYISFELFVRPAIRTMLGVENVRRPVVRAQLTEGLRSPEGRRQFARGRYLRADGTVEPVGGSGSHLVGPLSRADALIVVPEAATRLEPGAEVDVVLLTED